MLKFFFGVIYDAGWMIMIVLWWEWSGYSLSPDEYSKALWISIPLIIVGGFLKSFVESLDKK